MRHPVRKVQIDTSCNSRSSMARPYRERTKCGPTTQSSITTEPKACARERPLGAIGVEIQSRLLRSRLALDRLRGSESMKDDPIIEELHEVRARLAAKFNNDLRAICDDARA